MIRATVEAEAIGKTDNRGADCGDVQGQPDQRVDDSYPFKTLMLTVNTGFVAPISGRRFGRQQSAPNSAIHHLSSSY